MNRFKSIKTGQIAQDLRNLQNLRVLIIEDVDEMRELLLVTLKSLPECRSVGTARNTLEARLELDRRRPSLILLDEILPGESSYDFLEALKTLNHDLKDPTQVILLTGVSVPVHAIPEGVLGRLLKPDWGNLEVDQARFLKDLKSLLTAHP